MDAQKSRLMIAVAVGLLGSTIFSMWQIEQAEKAPKNVVQPVHSTSVNHGASVPAGLPEVSAPASMPHKTNNSLVVESPLVVVTNDLKITIDRKGGDVVRTELRQFNESIESENGVTVLDKEARGYFAESFLISNRGPDQPGSQRPMYRAGVSSLTVTDATGAMTLPLTWTSPEGITVTKEYRFQPNGYLIDLAYRVDNQSNQAFAAKVFHRLNRKVEQKKRSGFAPMPIFDGAAVWTPDKPFKKLDVKKLTKRPFEATHEGGWGAMMEHYFLSAWVPSPQQSNTFIARLDGADKYSIGAHHAFSALPGQRTEATAQLYVGPEAVDVLETVSPGLELTIDYGIFWFISSAIFWLLKQIHQFVGNWGVAIILVTCFIKALFYKLSATSYRSMGRMRQIQPRIESLKKQYGEDKAGFSQAMMKLYQSEKINPLGGCLPILIQIPVFIALYYVLLESVELRHAPFMLWIQDLSAKDPFYVLPILMGISMLVQQRLSPPPPDPVQAKIMMFMPVLFTGLFLSFPSGLVLYWLVNNLLSIAQQAYITYTLEREGIPTSRSKN